ncbi:MAG: class I SAM-dependent methyltransferase [Candidatus Hydrogenedentota bacterium]
MRENDELQGMSKADIDATTGYYRDLFHEHGASAKALGWNRGRQTIRFASLMAGFQDLESPNILDLGCGFGDLNHYLAKCFDEYRYVGVDLTQEFVSVAQEAFTGTDHISFFCDDFLKASFDSTFDIVVASGTFNTKFASGENELFIRECFAKAFSLCNEGISFDFLSDRVDRVYEHSFHSSPENILSIALSHTKNVTLNYTHLPFEFCVTAFKDDSYDTASVVFNRYLQRGGSELLELSHRTDRTTKND